MLVELVVLLLLLQPMRTGPEDGFEPTAAAAGWWCCQQEGEGVLDLLLLHRGVGTQ